MEFSLMVDSGAHHFFEHNVRKGFGIEEKEMWDWEAYKSKEFWDGVENYIKFIKEYKDLLDIYVVMDAIYEPEISWQVYKYMKYKHKLDPMPVYHYNEPIAYFKKYMKETDFIGISGLGQGIPKNKYINWANKVFSLVCDSKTLLPNYKIHGFAMTSTQLIKRYPFYSVDSSSWVQYSQYGQILVPKVKNNKFNFLTRPYVIFVSTRCPDINIEGLHFNTLTQTEKKSILYYLESIGVKYGKSEFKEVDANYKPKENEFTWGKLKNGKRTIEVVHEYGVSNRHEYRDIVNYEYHVKLENHLEWPRPWIRSKNDVKRLF